MADPITIIGQETKVSGNLQGDEDLTVQGRVEGTIQLSKTLTIEPSGVVVADVRVRNAVVSGVIVGNVTATEAVHITQGGRMVGDIAAPRVIIVDGASYRGQVDMGDLEAARPTGEIPKPRMAPPIARPALRQAPPPPKAVQTPKGVAVRKDDEKPAQQQKGGPPAQKTDGQGRPGGGPPRPGQQQPHGQPIRMPQMQARPGGPPGGGPRPGGPPGPRPGGPPQPHAMGGGKDKKKILLKKK